VKAHTAPGATIIMMDSAPEGCADKLLTVDQVKTCIHDSGYPVRATREADSEGNSQVPKLATGTYMAWAFLNDRWGVTSFGLSSYQNSPVVSSSLFAGRTVQILADVIEPASVAQVANPNPTPFSISGQTAPNATVIVYPYGDGGWMTAAGCDQSTFSIQQLNICLGRGSVVPLTRTMAGPDGSYQLNNLRGGTPNGIGDTQYIVFSISGNEWGEETVQLDSQGATELSQDGPGRQNISTHDAPTYNH
jgi:hypothetical protein